MTWEQQTQSRETKIAQLQADALTVQDKINEQTSDPERLRHLAGLAIDHFNDRAAELYLGQQVRASGTLYAPSTLPNGMPDIDNARILHEAWVDGISEGFGYNIDTVDMSALVDQPEDKSSEVTLASYARVELGHTVTAGLYRRASLLGVVGFDLTVFAPLGMSTIGRLEDIGSSEALTAAGQLPQVLVESLDDILAEDGADLRLDRLDNLFRRLQKSPKYSSHVDNCLRYANALIGDYQSGIEIIADYACVADQQGNFMPYTFTDVIEGQYTGLCLTIAYAQDRTNDGLIELTTPQLGLKLKYADKDDLNNIVTIPISSIHALAWNNSRMNEGRLDYTRPLQYGRRKYSHT